MSREFFRYFLASILALLTDYVALYALTEAAGFNYLLSASLGFALGVCVIYMLSVNWVFRYRKYHSRATEFLVFLAIGLTGLALNGGIIWFATEILDAHYLLSKLISAGFVFSFNFVTRRMILFFKAETL